ncbi:HU family DNA-binding protein [bacterium]|nr:HU family DNA-binding protein [bacterium]MCI0566527.1 HU family DNA-binding protein [bacterium]
MNKQALVDIIHEKMGGTRAAADEVMETVISSIIKTLKSGDEVSIAGLGTFIVKNRAARMARNPRTGEQVQVAASRVPKFKPAKALKDAVK